MWNKDTKLVTLIFVVSVGLLLLSLIYVFLFVPWDTNKYTMECQKYDGIVRGEWQRSDKISNYGDIPKRAKENLSHETRVNLAGTPPKWFDGTEYANLSEKQQENVRDSINNTIRLEDTIYLHQLIGTHADSVATVDSIVFYQDSVYFCGSDRVQMGA